MRNGAAHTQQSSFWPLAILTVLSACGGGPVAPSGTDLSGRWIASSITYTDTRSGTSVTVQPRFVVNASSAAIETIQLGSSEVICTDVGPLAQSSPCGIAISGGKFRYKSSSADGSVSLEISGTFRSSTSADGEWTDHNRGPAGYFFHGDLKTNWTANRQ
jgi:hypothetical protein